MAFSKTSVALKESINGLYADSDKIRLKHFKTILPVIDDDPSLLYPFWDDLVSLLGKEEVSSKYYAILLIAKVITEDNQNKFDELFDSFFELLEYESPVISLNAAAVSGKIANAKPHLEQKITDRLFKASISGKARHTDLLNGYIIQAFADYFDIASDKDKIVEFVENQLTATSPKARKLAKLFLKTNMKI